MDEYPHTYYFTPPKVDGHLYFTVETYFNDIVPEECITGTQSPIATFEVA